MNKDKTCFTSLATAKDSTEMDRLSQEKYGISAEMLMESAGALSAQAILSVLKEQKKSLRVMLLCGPGHNGGDGLVTARHLLAEGVPVDVFLPDSKLPIQQEKGTVHLETGRENRQEIGRETSKDLSLYERQVGRLGQQGLTFKSLSDQESLKLAVQKAGIIVDALFGVGLSKNFVQGATFKDSPHLKKDLKHEKSNKTNVQGLYAELIQWINSANRFMVSLDTPSGLNVDTGHVRGCGVKADLTLSFGLAKPGFYLMEGPTHVGQLKVFSIGFPPAVLFQGKKHFLIKKSWVSAQLPRRGPADHKAQHGHLLVLAGSEGFQGAGCLTAEAGYRMGAGYVTMGIPSQPPQEGESAVLAKPAILPDILTQKIEDSISNKTSILKNKTAVAIGPGLGTGDYTKQLLLDLKKSPLPVVVDADAWTVCVREGMFPLPSHWLCTPHSGELARILKPDGLGKGTGHRFGSFSLFKGQDETGSIKPDLFNITGKEVDQDRCFYAMKASEIAGCLVLLKGFHSVLAQKDKCWIIPVGCSALAKAGTGDVLTGFVGALMARGLPAFSAGAVGAFVHGLLAEEWVQSGKDADCLMAQDLKDILPFVLQKLRSCGTYL